MLIFLPNSWIKASSSGPGGGWFFIFTILPYGKNISEFFLVVIANWRNYPVYACPYMDMMQIQSKKSWIYLLKYLHSGSGQHKIEIKNLPPKIHNTDYAFVSVAYHFSPFLKRAFIWIFKMCKVTKKN